MTTDSLVHAIAGMLPSPLPVFHRRSSAMYVYFREKGSPTQCPDAPGCTHFITVKPAPSQPIVATLECDYWPMGEGACKVCVRLTFNPWNVESEIRSPAVVSEIKPWFPDMNSWFGCTEIKNRSFLARLAAESILLNRGWESELGYESLPVHIRIRQLGKETQDAARFEEEVFYFGYCLDSGDRQPRRVCKTVGDLVVHENIVRINEDRSRADPYFGVPVETADGRSAEIMACLTIEPVYGEYMNPL